MVVQELVSSLFPDDAEGRVGVAAGGVLFALGVFDSDAQRAQLLKVAGAGLLAFFFLREQKRTVASRADIMTDASLPVGNSGVSLQEKWNALVGRAVGIEPEAGIEDKPERAADDRKGPSLPAARNLLGVAGAWRQPLDGGTIPIGIFSGTFQAFAVLENQTAKEVAGQVRVRIVHEGLLQGSPQITMFDGPFLRLAPGELRQLDMRLPTVRDADGKIGLALLFSGYNLSGITAQRSMEIA